MDGRKALGAGAGRWNACREPRMDAAPKHDAMRARVERVVDVVVDRVEARRGARVLAGRAAGRRRLLRRRVGDEVALRAAPAVEGVLEVQPVADLVRAGL